MQIEQGLHCLRLPFKVTPSIERFVNIGILAGQRLYLVDTGVAASYGRIEDCLRSMGKGMRDVGGILLTHSHPDHIGCAARIKRESGCPVYAPEAERDWIEDIGKQFAARPVPNFHALAGESVAVDTGLRDGDVLALEPGLTVQVLATPGHSAGSSSLYWREKETLFTGDAVPVPGDIPIYDDSGRSIASLEKLLAFTGVRHYLPAWDTPCGYDEGLERMQLALAFLRALRAAVDAQLAADPDAATLPARVCREMGQEHLLGNPLFARTVLSHVRN